MWATEVQLKLCSVASKEGQIYCYPNPISYMKGTQDDFSRRFRRGRNVLGHVQEGCMHASCEWSISTWGIPQTWSRWPVKKLPSVSLCQVQCQPSVAFGKFLYSYFHVLLAKHSLTPVTPDTSGSFSLRHGNTDRHIMLPYTKSYHWSIKVNITYSD